MNCHAVGKESKTLVVVLVFSLAVLSAISVIASIMIPLEGTTTIIANEAPVRSAYPDGRILDVLKKGAVVEVTSLVGDGRGMWVSVQYKKEDTVIRGFVDSELTSAGDDMKSGRLKSPGKK